jgi:RNA polymerase sigma-70 factor, ECF subfamily
VTAAVRLAVPERTDAELAAAAGADADAFAALYHRYADRVFARLTHLVGPVPEREDLLQQVFLGLHRALPGFRGESSLSTFLYRITVNVAYDHLRSRKRRPIEHSADDLDALMGFDLSPEERADKREELGQALALLEQLSPAKRIAFALVAIEGLSLGDAARLLSISPDAAKQRVLQARRDLVEMADRAARTARRTP